MTFEFEIIFFIGWLIKLVIFQQISQYKFKFSTLISIPLVFTLISYFYYDIVFWGEIFFLPIIAFVIKRKEGWNWTQYVFYSFFPLVIDEIFTKTLGIYVAFVLREYLVVEELDIDLFGWVSSVLNVPFYFLFLKFTQIDSKNFQIGAKFSEFSRFVKYFNINLVFIYIIFYILNSLPSMEYEGWISINFDLNYYGKLILFTYTPIFLGFSLYINYILRQKSEDEVRKIKDEQIKSLSKYSTHMESLYKEIRSFRHDYTNLLSSLNYAIKNRDIDGVEEIYQSVFKNSDEQFKSSRYDIANLSNIDNESLKSVISLKMIEAQHKGINLSVEVENHISAPDSIELIDLLKIVSIFLDNALEASVQAEEPSLSFAYFETNSSKVMIIENSTKEKKLNTKAIFNYGYSSKGIGRGVGLANVKGILDSNPTISLQTTSDNHTFRQELTFNNSDE